MVATHYALKLHTSVIYLQTHSARVIQHFNKKSTLNLEHHASAEAGTKATLFSG